jgi:hypothetical protein
MMKRLLNNKKGTAEVIGTVLFIVILLFFFTNVYLWHDAATKEMNQEYLSKINSPITVIIQNSSTLNVTNRGGVDTMLATVWQIVGSPDGVGPDLTHARVEHSEVVPAGKSVLIPIPSPIPSPSDYVTYKVVTVNGNTASCTSSPP